MRFIWIITLLSLSTLSLNTWGQEEGAPEPLKTPEPAAQSAGVMPMTPVDQNFCKPRAIDNIADAPKTANEAKTIAGSSQFKYCQKIINGSWRDVVQSTKTDGFKNASGFIAFDEVMTRLTDYYNSQYAQILSRGTAATNNQTLCEERSVPAKMLVKKATETIKEARAELLNCMALAAMTSQLNQINFDDSDHISKGETASVDGKLKCVTQGAETQDFPACKHFAYTYTTFIVGQKGVETIQSVTYATKSMDRQEELAKTASGAAKKALEAQRDALEDQKSMADANAAFHGAKGATLLAFYKKIPDPAEAVEKCKKGLNDQVIEQVDAAATKVLESFVDKIQTERGFDKKFLKLNEIAMRFDQISPCDTVAESGNVFMNQKAKQTMLEMMMQAGVDTLANVGKSMILNKQANMMDKAINELTDFTASVTIPTFATASVTADYCAMYPADAACADLVNSRRYDLGVGGITIGGGSALTTGDQAVSRVDTGTATGSGSSDRTNTVGSTGTTLGDISKGGGFTDTVAAASMKDGGAGGGAGGGGGGGVGSVSAPSSGGGGGDGNTAAAASAAGVKGAAYIGGGSHSYSGGLGSAKKRVNEANPLDGLFNKNQAKTGGDVLDFRGVASINDKEKDLFKLISNRYDTVNKSKRLIEYDTVPK